MATAPAEDARDGHAVAAFLAGLITGSVAEYRRDDLLRARVESIVERPHGFRVVARTASGLRADIEIEHVPEGSS